jgi:predicted CoA-binding protein
LLKAQFYNRQGCLKPRRRLWQSLTIWLRISSVKNWVVGVSNKRETGCNLNFKKFKDAGYQVFPVNPHINTYAGQTCYPDLKAIPDRPDGVFILASPQVTDQIVQQCVDLGIKHIWMHCAVGTKPGLLGSATSVSQQAVDLCKANGIAVIGLVKSVSERRI